MYANPAAANSVKQNAYQVPSAPRNLLKQNAAGMIITTYRKSDIYRDGRPFPNPSSAPEQVTETADTMNPRLMICKAATPLCNVSCCDVNNPINFSGISQDRIVPTAITPMVSASVVWKIFLTRSLSPAP